VYLQNSTLYTSIPYLLLGCKEHDERLINVEARLQEAIYGQSPYTIEHLLGKQLNRITDWWVHVLLGQE